MINCCRLRSNTVSEKKLGNFEFPLVYSQGGVVWRNKGTCVSNTIIISKELLEFVNPDPLSETTCDGL